MKTPDPTEKAELSAPNSAKFAGKSKLTPRQHRVIKALAATNEWLFREDIDRISGSSNGPQIILELRRKVTGDDGIDMRQIDGTDRDGRPCRPGQYRLNEGGRSRAAMLGLLNG